MKFALNHKHRFDNHIAAFFTSFALLAIMMFIEVVNFFMILQTSDLNNLIQNVTALVIIAEADVLLYTTLNTEVLKDLLTMETFQAVCLQIARSSSDKLVEYKEKELEIQHDALYQWKKEQEELKRQRDLEEARQRFVIN